MEDCIFCKIINGDIPSYTVYEDDVVKAFLDISQVTPGHTLVIPKHHVANLFEYDDNLAKEVLSRLPKIARAIQASDPSIVGMNVMNNNGEVAYQSVFHSHWHLIPRYNDDDDFSIHFGDHTDQYDEAKYTAIQTAIQKQFEAQ